MSTCDPSEELELVVKGRQAAYCARRRLNGADLSPQDMEDLVQTATLAYWKHHRKVRPVPFCFVCARQAAEKHFYRQLMGRNPRNALSMDTPLHDGGDLPHEWLNVPSLADDRTMRLDWLSDEVLEGVLLEARQAAGYAKHCLTHFWDTILKEKRIIRLAANGHTNASIAELMGTTEGTIRNRRQRIRRLLEHLLPVDACVEYSRTGGNQQRACEIQSAYPGRRKPETA
ncbi:sigma factor-like helix-turn-helix DNA-binding protein [Chloroflexota bacterium]